MKHQIVSDATDDERMQVPIGTKRMEYQLVEEDGQRQMVYMFADGQQRCHNGIATLHHNIGDCVEGYLPHKLPQALVNVHQVT